MDNFVLRSRNGILLPTDEAGEEYIRELGRDQTVMARLWLDRSHKYHRWFWAFMGEAAKQIDGMDNADTLVTYLKIKTHMYTPIVNVWARPDGTKTEQLVVVPKSLKMSSMDEVAFRRVVRRMLDVLYADFGIEPDSFREEVESMLATYGPVYNKG